MKTTEQKSSETPVSNIRTQSVTVTLKDGTSETFEVIGSVQNGDGLTLKFPDKSERKFPSSDIESITTENP